MEFPVRRPLQLGREHDHQTLGVDGKQALVEERVQVRAENDSRIRWRMEAIEAPPGTSLLTFTAVRRTGEVPSEERSRDLDLELELVSRLEPDAAARILQAVGSTSR